MVWSCKINHPCRGCGRNKKSASGVLQPGPWPGELVSSHVHKVDGCSSSGDAELMFLQCDALRQLQVG